ncbi:MAG: ATP-binding protein [Bacteroidia bacterium]
MVRAKRYFNTSGPNIPEEHYTLMRPNLISEGTDMVRRNRYFTIWAPRQTGKSTYFQLLSQKLVSEGYKVATINLENFSNIPISSFFDVLLRKIDEGWGIQINVNDLGGFLNEIEKIQSGRHILIIDEIEGLNPEIFGNFLHTIRSLYHTRATHCLKSVILVGVSNIVGMVEDHASPFNIADNLEIPYFSKEETFELLHQHEEETGQIFNEDVKAKISDITANQPGLVNGFGFQLVKRSQGKPEITLEDYLEVEDWYLTEVIDKNVANILKYAKKHRRFVEKLLFTDEEVHFDIDREETKVLHTNGLIKKDSRGNIAFWVPLYKKRLYTAFYPYTNGEKLYFFNRLDDFFDLVKNDQIDFDFLIQNYKDYVKRRSFKAFREKDPETNEYKSLKEAALKYSFETYISLFLDRIGAKFYTEVDTGLGRSDILINYQNKEYVIEAKVYRESYQIRKGLSQLAYYCKSIGVKEGLYLVFASNALPLKGIAEGVQELEGVRIMIYVVDYDEEKDF